MDLDSMKKWSGKDLMKFNRKDNEILYPVPVYTHTTLQAKWLEGSFLRNDLELFMTELCLCAKEGW